MSGKWHAVKLKKHDDSLDQLEDEFRQQGTLVSICREPPQNSTDNPISDDACVEMHYSMRKIQLTEEQRMKMFPQNPWINHITAPQNDDIMNYQQSGNLSPQIESEFDVLVVEDYSTTGLLGDVSQMLPETVGDTLEYTKETDDNTWFWFLRSRGAKRQKKGRGGSHALGKLAFPLASKVRTFFVVTTTSEGKRYLCGQSVLRNHVYHTWYDGILYFGDSELHDIENEHTWLPISNEEEIDNFCETFKVNRPKDSPGTSIIVIMPREELTGEKIGYGILSNYFVPILNNKLKVKIQTEEMLAPEIFDSTNVKRFLKIDRLDWTNAGIKRKINQKPNPAWSTLGRMRELDKLYDTVIGNNSESESFVLGTPPEENNIAPHHDSSFELVLPSKGSDQLEEMKTAYNAGKYLLLSGKIPIKGKDGITVNGEYKLAIHKTDSEDDAEAHFYRDCISLPLVNKKKAAHPSVSSLFIVEGGNDNPLAAMLRDSEGPAHLDWNKFDKVNKDYYHGARTVTFIRELVPKLVNRMISVSSEKEELWASLFSLGKKKEKEITHYFEIIELEHGGVIVSPPNERIVDDDGNEINFVGKEFVARVGYPKPFAENPKNPPDRRAIDVHGMNWSATGADISFDVEATKGGICYDRVRILITDPEFSITLEGTNTELKAQIILNEVVNK